MPVPLTVTFVALVVMFVALAALALLLIVGGVRGLLGSPAETPAPKAEEVTPSPRHPCKVFPYTPGDGASRGRARARATLHTLRDALDVLLEPAPQGEE